MLLTVSLVLNFGFLGFFKYFNFFIDSFASLAALVGLQSVPLVVWKIVLPPGISFYTFQEVAYIVDVYQRKLRAADSLVDYALVHQPVPAPDRRPDPAAVPPAAAGAAAAHLRCEQGLRRADADSRGSVSESASSPTTAR